jgi:hypothetical protein
MTIIIVFFNFKCLKAYIIKLKANISFIIYYNQLEKNKFRLQIALGV